jgi:leucyl aminopeptidase
VNEVNGNMKLDIQPGNILQTQSDLAVLGVFEDVPRAAEVAELLLAEDFTGSAGQSLLLYPRGAVAPRRLFLVGMGKAADAKAEVYRRAGAAAVQQARTLKVAHPTIGIHGDSSVELAESAQAFVEGFCMGAYRFWRYRTNLTEAQQFTVQGATILGRDVNVEALRAGLNTGEKVARGVDFARDLVNSPGYHMTPAKMAEEAVELGQRTGLKVTVLDKAQLTEQGFGGILAVGQGSANDPRFIMMEHGEAGNGKPTICLVGKGLTFDSGGLSIKPADAMDTMKSDMAGSAAVFGAMQVVAELNLPLHVVGLVPSAENMPGSAAYRPGDVVKTLSGKTVEVLNTDAEGRIILADGLFYAQRYNPAAIIELSTLTGAIIIALGAHATGLMATDQALADQISRAGEVSGERVWQLPLWDEYHQMIKSDIADLKNIGGRPAGSITAGAFLAAFTADYPFAHLDIAGTSFAAQPARPYDAPGATGVGVRLLTAYLQDLVR